MTHNLVPVLSYFRKHHHISILMPGLAAALLLPLAAAATGQVQLSKSTRALLQSGKNSDDKLPGDIAQLIKRVDLYRSQGSFLRAQALLSDAFKSHPGDFALTLEQARLLRSMGQVAKSKALYQLLHSQDANAVEPLIALSQMSLDSLALDDSLKYAHQVVAIAPGSRAAHLCLAAALLSNNSLTDANTELNAVEHKFPASGEAQYLRYQLFLKQNQRDQALSALENAVKLIPTNSSWIMDLSSLYTQEGDYTQALELLNRYLRVNPSSIEALSRIAALYEYNFHDYDKAIGIYQEILNLDPDVVDAVVGIDRCKQKGNDIAAALKDQLWRFFRQSKTFGDNPKAPARSPNWQR